MRRPSADCCAAPPAWFATSILFANFTAGPPLHAANPGTSMLTLGIVKLADKCTYLWTLCCVPGRSICVIILNTTIVPSGTSRLASFIYVATPDFSDSVGLSVPAIQKSNFFVRAIGSCFILFHIRSAPWRYSAPSSAPISSHSSGGRRVPTIRCAR